MTTNHAGGMIPPRKRRNTPTLLIALTVCASALVAADSPRTIATPTGAPTATTYSATSVNAFGATLDGRVNPNGLDTLAQFEYGETTDYGRTTREEEIPGWLPGGVPMAGGRVTGLACNTLFHFRAVAWNVAGTSYGSDLTFTTLGCPAPTVTTGQATDVTVSSATLHGSANPNQSPTTANFEYGPTTSYGHATPEHSLGSGLDDVPIGGGNITGLACDTLYHFRAIASNTVGSAHGDDATFRTFVCAVNDFDGDGRTDRTVFRPSNGLWYMANSGGGATATAWGLADDIDVAGDYDGDGHADITMWRPSTGIWFIVQSATDTVRTAEWGMSGDIPLAGDVDGDGKDDLVIYRPGATSTWFVSASSGAIIIRGWGTAGDQPLLGDFDGDERMDFTVYRPATGVWYIASSDGSTRTYQWGGEPGDVALLGNFDMDSDYRADCVIFRPSTGQWLVRANSYFSGTWGAEGDVPLVGDWNGDGIADVTVWRPTNGAWYTLLSTGAVEVASWGLPDDRAIGRRPD